MVQWMIASDAAQDHPCDSRARAIHAALHVVRPRGIGASRDERLDADHGIERGELAEPANVDRQKAGRLLILSG
jgi:hypothetical protein